MYSYGMVAPGGEIVVVAGQVGMDDRRAVAVGDVGAQTKQALENVRAIVEAAGCTMGHIVRLQTFLTHAEDIPAFMAARGEVFPKYFPGGAYPPNTLLVVSRLVQPELLVEIEAMAVKPAAAAATRPKAAKPKAAKKPAGRRRASRKRR
jgi:enamine deaminase RidA (YjgF/YER057c/UK114 family)